MVEAVQGRSYAEALTPNPCSLEDCRGLAERIRAEVGAAPAWLQERLRVSAPAAVVVGIGGHTGAFGNCAQACGREAWTAEELWAAIERLAGSSDADLRAAGFSTERMILPKLVLVHTVMVTAGLASVRHLPSEGGCTGMLLCEALWPPVASGADAAS